MKKGQTRVPIATTGDTHDYLLSRVPQALWTAIVAQSAREGVSLRQAILRTLSRWSHAGGKQETRPT